MMRAQEGEHRERGSVERQTERHHLRRVEVHRHARNHQTAIMIARVPGISSIPAYMGGRPETNCRCWEAK